MHINYSHKIQAPTTKQIYTNIVHEAYVLPDTASYEARDLVLGLLQIVRRRQSPKLNCRADVFTKEPTHRIPVHRVLSHPFFNPALPISLLCPRPTSASAKLNRPITGLAYLPLSSPLTQPAIGTSSIPQCMPNSSPCRIYDKAAVASGRFKNPAGLPVRRFFSDPTSYSGSVSQSGFFRARSVSDYSTLHQEDSDLKANKLTAISTIQQHELPYAKPGAARSRTATLTPAVNYAGSDSGFDSGDDSNAERYSCDDGDTGSRLVRTNTSKAKLVDDDLADHPLLRRPITEPPLTSLPFRGACLDEKSDWGAQDLDGGLKPLEDRSNLNEKKAGRDTTADFLIPFHAAENASQSDGVTPLNTRHLAPRTHKLTSGSITVLPSKSLLVDLREGERRKGKKGDEVLVISADGHRVCYQPCNTNRDDTFH
jgi:hypothetical protein